MKRTKYFFPVLALIFATGPCNAFETETHALITNEAYQQSVLAASGNGSVVNILGLDRLNASLPFGVYWKADGGNAYYTDGGKVDPSAFFTGVLLGYLAGGVTPQQFERCQMQEFLNIDPQDPERGSFFSLFNNMVSLGGSPFAAAYDNILPIRNWLVRGAIREDDLGYGTAGEGVPAALQTYACGNWWALTTNSQPGEMTRSLNHFYNPINGSGLDTTIVTGDPSVFWALGYVNNVTDPPVINANRQNTYSYEDAHNSWYWALTRELTRVPGQPYTSQEHELDAYDRMFLWATTFRSLGDVVHLLEDAGQPQHTRNDAHSVFNSDEQQAFEGYTNIRVLGTGKLNSYNRVFFPDSLQGISAPPLGTYPGAGQHWIEFASPLSYFSTGYRIDDSGDPLSRYGLADYTNRGFFTGGTLPGSDGDGFDYPKNPAIESSQYQTISAPCIQLGGNPQLQDVTCTHYTSSVPDGIAPGYPDQLPPGFDSAHVPLVTEGVLAEFATNAGLAPGNPLNFALGMEELDTIGDMTIPRSVGYATGMIDFFFRGVGGIAITPPASGVYAIVDQAQTHSMNADGYPCTGNNPSDGCPIFGFTAVQVNMQNVMNPIIESGIGDTVPQDMFGGQLVAVARFHRNTCYQPDLSGELTYDMNAQAVSSSSVPADFPPNCPDPNAFSLGRSPFPEIAVSAPIAVDGQGHITAGVAQESDINGDAPTLVQFDFGNDPIPINATDLFIQVVYRGTIGDVQSADSNRYELDAIAVGSVDVSEPTYSVFMNIMNYFYDASTQSWMTVAQAKQQNFQVDDTFVIPNITVCAGAGELLAYGNQGDPAGLAAGHAIRLAMILDPTAVAQGTRLYDDWTTPVAGIYNGAYVDLGGTIYGELDSFENLVGGWPAQLPYLTVGLAQASMESNAKGDYTVQAIPAGVGVTWGHNIYFVYQTSSNLGESVPLPLVPPVPQNPPLSGSNGVFLPDPIPQDEVWLNLPSPYCESESTQAMMRMMPNGGGGKSVRAASSGRSQQ